MLRTMQVRIFRISVRTNGDTQNNNLHVIMYGCEIWSLTLRKKQRLIVFENRVLRKIYGNIYEGYCDRKLKELLIREFHNLHTSRNNIRMIKSRRMRRAGYVARI
jgi:hypothetical protein